MAPKYVKIKIPQPQSPKIQIANQVDDHHPNEFTAPKRNIRKKNNDDDERNHVKELLTMGKIESNTKNPAKTKCFFLPAIILTIIRQHWRDMMMETVFDVVEST